ncbi:hypothetical protein Pint_24570 [Pistacia integerrima]|uniref:Uncharacterized protein n=1 Tax=Pistacia integerrima TaxID=434235 RepID=A0ACC0YBV6_9ROSI|nr:hypothetical protein Pint_24570 [Pistacia integerrima]
MFRTTIFELPSNRLQTHHNNKHHNPIEATVDGRTTTFHRRPLPMPPKRGCRQDKGTNIIACKLQTDLSS